ncbi:MAG: agmatinase [Oscillospiraceae bacterium]|nr:agmatinase [Oscillospiraceae bacterium]
MKFISCESSFAAANIVIFGAPYDGTTSNRPGARFAGRAIRAESYGMETYSPYLDKDLSDFKIHDGGDLELPFGDPVPVLDMVCDYTKSVLAAEKIPLMLGGEHLVTLGAFRAVHEKFPQVNIVHFDAHADLRDEYLGQRLSHATVMRRCYDLIGDEGVFQFGIRSGEREEFRWGENHVYTEKFTVKTIPNIIKKLKDKPVYLTIDLDVLDTGVFPATGTPEAGGISFNELLNAIEQVSQLNIVGADICELSPPYDNTGASTALACKVVRELILSLR